MNTLNKVLLSAVISFTSLSLSASSLEIEWQAQEHLEHSWYKPVRAPFSVDDVIAHAQTRPSNYEMAFLKSARGTSMIAEIIAKLNDDQKPANDVVSLIMRWNKGTQGAGYNKSVVAHYVSTLFIKSQSED